MKHVLKHGCALIPEQLTLLLWTALLAPGTYAAGAHIHGQGQLDIAVDDGRVELFLTAPLGDLNSGTDGSDEALAARFGAADLFVFANADCTLEESSIEVLEVDEDYWEESASEDGDHDEHDDEAGHHADADHHDKDDHHADADHDHHHEAEHHDEGDHHEDEAHHVADEEDHSGHKDLALAWVYRCSQDPQNVRVTLFDATQLEKIKVQAIGASGATAATLTAEERDVELP